MSFDTPLTRKSTKRNDKFHQHYIDNNYYPYPCCERLPSLELVLSEDEDSSTKEICDRVPWDEPTISRLQTDVHWCPSKACSVCQGRKPQSATLFVRVPTVDAFKLRRLPQRWWIEDYCDPKVMESVLSTLFCVFSEREKLLRTVEEDKDDSDASDATVQEEIREQQTEVEAQHQSDPPLLPAVPAASPAVDAPFDEM